MNAGKEYMIVGINPETGKPLFQFLGEEIAPPNLPEDKIRFVFLDEEQKKAIEKLPNEILELIESLIKSLVEEEEEQEIIEQSLRVIIENSIEGERDREVIEDIIETLVISRDMLLKRPIRLLKRLREGTVKAEEEAESDAGLEVPKDVVIIKRIGDRMEFFTPGQRYRISRDDRIQEMSTDGIIKGLAERFPDVFREVIYGLEAKRKP